MEKIKYTEEQIDLCLYNKNLCMSMINTKKKYKKGFPRIEYLENERYRCYQIEVSEGEKLKYFCYDGKKREEYYFVHKRLGFFQKLIGITFEKNCEKMELKLNFLIESIKNREKCWNILKEQGIIKHNEVVN